MSTPYPSEADPLPDTCCEHSNWQATNDLQWAEYLIDEYPQ